MAKGAKGGPPVMAEVVFEVPLGLGGRRLAEAGEAIRAACGERAGIPPGLPALRLFGGPQASYSSSTGRKFVAAPGCQFIRAEARLRHPCGGGTRAEVLAAGELFEAAARELGAGRGIYGASGVHAWTAPERQELKARLEARWWSPECAQRMEEIAKGGAQEARATKAGGSKSKSSKSKGSGPGS